MADLRVRTEGRAGRVTLTRPKALNALSREMVQAIDAALIGWAADPAVALVLIDAEDPRAFCAGGDIAIMHQTGTAGDLDYGREFWREEYRMNARLSEYPKPVVTLMQGFTMGGGVGLGCHAAHRVVGETSRLSMPECTIGLVPDVGGSRLLARAPLGVGRYLGLTGARMGPGCAILAGFADHFIPEAAWPALTEGLVATGDPAVLDTATRPAPDSALGAAAAAIGWAFAPDSVAAIVARLEACTGDWVGPAQKALARTSPLSLAVTLGILDRLDPAAPLRDALAGEYRFTYRAMEHGDFLEGIRALIIDKDNAPRWRHPDHDAVTAAEVAALLAPLGPHELRFQEETP